MNVGASVALAVAERVERTAGPRAGLVAWKTLAGNASDGEIRGKALLAALRCAAALRDGDALDELTVPWGTVDRGVWDEPVAELCAALAKGAMLPRAVALAKAEAQRHRTARSLYCYARCLDVARDARAPEAFRDAIARAEREGAREIELASRVRLASLLARSWNTMAEAIVEANRVDAKEVPAASRLVLAGIRLRSPSRFARAAAVGVLDELAVGDDEALAFRALALAAAMTDAAGDKLSPLEVDRLLALFGRERAKKLAPRATDAVRCVARIAAARDDASLEAALAEADTIDPELAPLRARARDVLSGRFGALRALLDIAAAGKCLPHQALGIARTALGSEDQELGEAAVELVGIHLRSMAMGEPPGGWSPIADALAALGKAELAVLARRAAAVAKEAGAAEMLATALTRDAWELARAGERAHAIRKLREAKALLAPAER